MGEEGREEGEAGQEGAEEGQEGQEAEEEEEEKEEEAEEEEEAQEEEGEEGALPGRQAPQGPAHVEGEEGGCEEGCGGDEEGRQRDLQAGDLLGGARGDCWQEQGHARGRGEGRLGVHQEKQ